MFKNNLMAVSNNKEMSYQYTYPNTKMIWFQGRFIVIMEINTP